MRTIVNIKRYQKQSGVVIIVALVTLLVMTMVGLTAIGNATLQERMAANNRFYLQARLNAETALREAEDYLSDRVVGNQIILGTANDVLAAITNNASIYLSNRVKGAAVAPLNTPSLEYDLAEQSSWVANFVSEAVPVNNADKDSQYIVEYIGSIDYSGSTSTGFEDLSGPTAAISTGNPWAFRITAIGYSSNSNIYSVVESIFATATR